MKPYYPKTDADREAMQIAHQTGCFSMLPQEKQGEVMKATKVVATVPLPKGAKVTQASTK